MSFKQSTLTEKASNLDMFDDKDFLTFGTLAGLLLLNLLFAAIIAYQTAHYIIRPLRKLNNKMIDIIFSTKAGSGSQSEIELVVDEESS